MVPDIRPVLRPAGEPPVQFWSDPLLRISLHGGT
jgi:hypothetical protein